jgi:hypothetical protein
MPKYQKRMARPMLAAVSLLAAGTLLAGCSSGSHHSSSSKSNKQGSSSQAGDSNNKAYEQALAYSKCMRSHGVSTFPDPKQDSQGHIRVQPPQGLDPNSATFQAAEQACQSLNPQTNTGEVAGGHALDASKVSKWAKCIRAHGLPNFQDPQVNGNSLIIDAKAAGISGPDDPKFAKAAQACYSIRPGGMLGFMGGGGPQ